MSVEEEAHQRLHEEGDCGGLGICPVCDSAGPDEYVLGYGAPLPEGMTFADALRAAGVEVTAHTIEVELPEHLGETKH